MTYLEEYVRKACSEIRSVDIKLFLSWQVHIVTPRTIHLDSWSGQLLWDTNREHMLPLTQDPRTSAESPLHELFSHLCEAVRRKDKSSVDDAVEVHCWLIDFKKVRVIKVFWVWAITSEDHLHCFPKKRCYQAFNLSLSSCARVDSVAESER